MLVAELEVATERAEARADCSALGELTLLDVAEGVEAGEVVDEEGVGKDVVEASDVAEGGALGSKPEAAAAELCSCFKTCSMICSTFWGDSGL